MSKATLLESGKVGSFPSLSDPMAAFSEDWNGGQLPGLSLSHHWSLSHPYIL